MTHLDSTIYCMVVEIVRMNGGKISEANQLDVPSNRKKTLHRKSGCETIECLRSDIATLKLFQRGDRSKYLKKLNSVS